MSYESDFDELLVHTVTNTTFSSMSGYGKKSYATSNSSYSARVVYKQRLVRAFDGQEKISNVTAWIASTGTISPKDKITLPDGTTPPILAVESFPDEDGSNHHIKVAFG